MRKIRGKIIQENLKIFGNYSPYSPITYIVRILLQCHIYNTYILYMMIYMGAL